MGNRAAAATSDECFQEKRNMEDLWKTIFLVGTEWDQFYRLSVQMELFKFRTQCLPVYGEEKVILIPLVVAGNCYLRFSLLLIKLVACNTVQEILMGLVVSPFPPSDKIGINSVQMEPEEIVPMNQMKMDWVPYIPLAYKDSQVDRLKSQIFILSCTQGRYYCLHFASHGFCVPVLSVINLVLAALRNLEKERIKKYKYCLPYFYQPFKEDEFEQSTVVDFFFPAEPPVISRTTINNNRVVDEKVTSGDIIEDQKDDFKNFVREKVKEAKNANREAKEARKKAVEEMSEDTKTAYDSMRFYKFYPVQSPDTPDVSSVKVYFSLLLSIEKVKS
ncbi:hypothetical protein IFM89_009447 [Coptis chinensis]|uniref:Uncharacterized protein n=1 Tax=Coptis chinensis TaxID=261450 RepID=A0A835I9A1_9MAGN|nr:hypothetical protein IFM89_009447 [Coptis chinensis]